MMETKIITIANRKGGAGKSTCAAHLSLEAVKSDKKVILIDLDPQKTLEDWWQKREDKNPFMADVNIQKLKEKISLIKKQNFDYCFIDTPGDTTSNTTEAIKIADIVIIPCKPTFPDLKSIGRTISIVKENSKNYLFILTQTIANSKSATQGALVLSEFGTIITTTISNRVSYMNAMSIGSSASFLDRVADKELKNIWSFIERKLLKNKDSKNEKEKI
jgi:chromosome partitioning protein